METILKNMNDVDHSPSAAAHLIKPQSPVAQNHQGFPASLLLRSTPEHLEIGLYLSLALQKIIQTVPLQSPFLWTENQFQALATLAEELSHFHYVLFRLGEGVPVSGLELELQGEIDRFGFFFFLLWQYFPRPFLFRYLNQRLFVQYHLHQNLGPHLKERYTTANTRAQQFFLRNESLFCRGNPDVLLKLLRTTYRMRFPEKAKP